MLHFQLLGTRGSRPILDQNYVHFGGNTTAYKIWAESNFPIYIDGGSGLFREGSRLQGDVTEFSFLLTHSHWDHILAFPFFAPFYRPETCARFWGSRSFKETFEELFKHQFQTDAFPVDYAEIPATISFNTIVGGKSFEIPPPPKYAQEHQLSSAHGSYHVSTYQINHPGLDLGYCIEHNGNTIVILTDLAPIKNNYLGPGMEDFGTADEVRYYEGLIAFCRNADLLLHDTHFNEESIRGKERWGHSTEIMAVRLALESQVKQLILGHHAPEDNDRSIFRKLHSARKYCQGTALSVIIPQEDEIITIS